MRSIIVPENVNYGEKSTKFFLDLWKNMYLVFFTLNESLFTALTLASSELIIEIGE